MSASVTSDRASIRKRGTLLMYIFANQGWGSLIGSLVVIVVLACYKHVMNDLHETSKVDGGESCLLPFISLRVELMAISQYGEFASVSRLYLHSARFTNV